MVYESYQLDSSESAMSFEFVSEGPRGRILKIIQYRKSPIEGVYHLGFGDKLNQHQIDDQAISNNGDQRKVLSTVAWSVYLFMEKHPDAWVAAFGNTSAKTRLYRMGINMIFDEISRDFHLYGIRNGIATPLEKNESYDGFLIRRKKVFL